MGSVSSRSGVGARVTVETDVTQTRDITTTVGYASASDPRALFGLGGHTTATRVTIRWPSGVTSSFEQVAADQYITVTE